MTEEFPEFGYDQFDADGYRVSRPTKYRPRTKKNCPECGTQMKGKGDFYGQTAHYRLLQCPKCGEVMLGVLTSSMRQSYLDFAHNAEPKEDSEFEVNSESLE